MTASHDKEDGPSAGTASPPDAGDLARRFLDLWQSQVQAMSTDPEVADAIARWTALWSGQGFGHPPARPMADGLQPGYGPSSSPPGSAYSAAHDGESGQHRSEPRRPTAGIAPGTAPAAAVSERGGDDLALILRELRRLEERIARLEARLERDGDEPEGPARRPGSRKGGGRRP
ncbi:MAG: hypothetical protein RLO01_07605 [Thalassobaculaceae bacterium]